ncbi:hypothetical protein FHS26_005863 [Rhizobium pisi]|uniref:Uncharacterized protein n=1 Tax=Rhizobium pisi TaxID=574561 RepID=A0A7W5BS12_9HYPH|nr:hypothetical protein [Rhizobium pisi]
MLFGIGNLSGNERQQTKDKVRRLFMQSRRPQVLHPDRRGMAPVHVDGSSLFSAAIGAAS